MNYHQTSPMAGSLLTPLSMFIVFLLPWLSAASETTFVIGGREASVGRWPWQGSLQVQDVHNCGCMLVSPKLALTAAHCITMSSLYYSVVFGLHDLYDFTIGRPTWYKPSEIIVHPNFTLGGVLVNDVALIHFDEDVAYNDYIQPIRMAPRDSDHDGAWCWTTGWGMSTHHGGMSPRLMEAEVPVVDTLTCREYWQDVFPGHVCAGVMGARGACYGDNGGPLVCLTQGHFEVIGVTSFTVIGCDPEQPSLYTRVSYYRDWISMNGFID